MPGLLQGAENALGMHEERHRSSPEDCSGRDKYCQEQHTPEKRSHRGTSKLSGLGADGRAFLTPSWGVPESSFSVCCTVLGTGTDLKGLTSEGTVNPFKMNE